MRLRNGTFLTVVLFGLCGLISLSWYTAFSNSKAAISHHEAGGIVSGAKSTQFSYLSKSKDNLVKNDSSKSVSHHVKYYVSKNFVLFYSF
ncbi:unnamed protein product [Oncorhynchus mykiss]|uniref:Uncharacterized protein n=1 Tax=Oncorhynchus mykiss TaxID=8022 RepID=A0A060WB53_ONCMY|nr:unnamed protein product [Oncorhynchus mykiss]